MHCNFQLTTTSINIVSANVRSQQFYFHATCVIEYSNVKPCTIVLPVILNFVLLLCGVSKILIHRS